MGRSHYIELGHAQSTSSMIHRVYKFVTRSRRRTILPVFPTMAPWIRTQPAQNTVDRYNVSPVDSEIDVHRSHSNVSRVSDALEAELVSKRNRTSVKRQPYTSDQTRTSGGYSHPFQSELRMQKTDEGITHTMVAEIPISRTGNSNIPPSLQIKRPCVDHTRVHSSAITSKFTEEF